MTDAQALESLRRVAFPGFRRDVVSLGVVRAVRLEAERATVEVEVRSLGAGTLDALEQAIRAALTTLSGIREVRIQRRGPTAALPMAGARPSVARGGALDDGLLPEVAHTIAVASGKGGVGKSTVAVNLAVALAALGQRVGLLDADIYGPSIPLMTGIAEAPQLTPERRIVPFERYGIRLMSLGFLVDPGSAVIWRGPMVMKAIEQLLRDVAWGALDVLVVDMPPGTGDAQLTLSQRVRLAGAVIVTTPQDVALADARKGVAMFQKVRVPVLGVVENMSYFTCPHCSGRSEIFGHGGGAAEARRLGVQFLGEIPLDVAVRDGGDRGRPIVDADPGAPAALALREVARHVLDALDGRAADATPGIVDRLRAAWRGPARS